jgi:hypothetical protein
MSDSESEMKNETEAIIYAKVSDFAGLEECESKEEHLQYEGSFANGMRCRVRRVSGAGRDVEYYFTFKQPTESSAVGIEANVEYTSSIPESFFEGFKAVAERKLSKTRYNFPSKSVTMKVSIQGKPQVITIPNVMYEVDVYKDQDEKPCEWCKIDVEVDTIAHYVKHQLPFDIGKYTLNIAVSHLPFKPKDEIVEASATPEEKHLIEMLWKDHFLLDLNK